MKPGNVTGLLLSIMVMAALCLLTAAVTAQPPEIKGLALLLASPASSFMTGTVIPIDGGLTCS